MSIDISFDFTTDQRTRVYEAVLEAAGWMTVSQIAELSGIQDLRLVRGILQSGLMQGIYVLSEKEHYRCFG